MHGDQGRMIKHALVAAVVLFIGACSDGVEEHDLPSAGDSIVERLNAEARAAAGSEAGLEAYRRMQAAAVRYDRPLAAITARLGRAKIFIAEDQLDSAEVVLREAINLGREQGHHFNTALALEGLGFVLEQTGRPDSALIFIGQAEAAASKLPEKPNMLRRIQERRERLQRDVIEGQR